VSKSEYIGRDTALLCPRYLQGHGSAVSLPKTLINEIFKVEAIAQEILSKNLLYDEKKELQRCPDSRLMQAVGTLVNTIT
jgi:hypothetical protein